VAGAVLAAPPRGGPFPFWVAPAPGAGGGGGAPPRFAKLSLELGGKNAMIVYADCDVDVAVEGAVRASFLNSGQICLCASRILIEDDGRGFYERFTAAYAERAASLVVGHPSHPDTNIGPLVSAAQRDKVLGLTRAALAIPSAVALCGGPDDARIGAAAAANGGDGHWFAPTILDGCDLDSEIAQREVFGPVVTVHRFRGDDEAIAAANGTAYGLAASVWTSDVERAHRVAQAMEAGTVWINCWLHRQLHMPFGGCKASGVAREGGESSLDFYSETSTICLKLGEKAPPSFPGRRRSA